MAVHWAGEMPAAKPAPETVVIKGVAYRVVFARTPQDLERAGLPELAATFKRDGIERHLVLRRLTGHRYYFSIERVVRTFSGRVLGAHHTDPIALPSAV